MSTSQTSEAVTTAGSETSPASTQPVPPPALKEAEAVEERARKLAIEMAQTQIFPEKKKGSKAIGDLVSSKLMEKYKGVSYIDTWKKGNNVWSDKNIKTLSYVEIKGYRSSTRDIKQSILEIGLSTLTGHVSASAVGALLAGAWGLVSCVDFSKYCFKDFPALANVGVPIQDLETRVIKSASQPITVKWTGTSDQEWARWERAAAFMCVATLRLVTKDEENLSNAWTYLLDQYKNFYREDIGFRIVLDRECIAGVRSLMQTRRALKETVAAFLLVFQDLSGQDRGMCKMLYELQMCYTGMHAYSLLLCCADKMGVPPAIFYGMLKHPATKDGLESIEYLLVNYEFPNNEEKKAAADQAKTWRYARIFDSDMFASLQPKNCAMLTSILATIAHKLGATGAAGDVTKIKQIEAMMASQREWLDKRAEKMIKYALGAGRE